MPEGQRRNRPSEPTVWLRISWTRQQEGCLIGLRGRKESPDVLRESSGKAIERLREVGVFLQITKQETNGQIS